MKIAVIGDYDSPQYRELLKWIRILMSEEVVLDLSRHKWGWKKNQEERFADIESAHQVIISENWHDHLESKWDVTESLTLKKEIFIERSGHLLPFPEYANRT